MTWLEEQRLNRYYELAERDANIRQDLRNSQGQILQHLFNIYFMKDSQSVDHWILKIFSFLHKVNKRKSTNRLPSESFIYESLFGNSEDSFEDWFPSYVSHIECKYDIELYPTPEDVDILFSICKRYFHWVAKELSIKGELNNKQAYRRLCQLFNLDSKF